jgi:hypothetical protein
METQDRSITYSILVFLKTSIDNCPATFDKMRVLLRVEIYPLAENIEKEGR